MANPPEPRRPAPVAWLVDALERERSPTVLLCFAALIAIAYVATIFPLDFILGHGSFWANPRGPWLMDPADRIENIDLLGVQVGYLGFLKTSWHLPVFYVPNLGAPAGTSVIYADATPLVALLGKLASELIGHPVNPYGLWTAACFVLSAVFAGLFVIELGQRSLLAVAAASVLALSAPTLLHRFGHPGLMAHFFVIGALLFYLRDRRVVSSWTLTARWAVWLCLTTLLHAYLFAMVAAVYAASLLRRLDRNRGRALALLRELLIIAGALALVMVLAGHFGKGTSSGYPAAWGFGYYSMNLASPFWPQRSGLFPGLQAIIDATGGQYEGFNYFGFGAILLIGAAILLNIRQMRGLVLAHDTLCAVLVCLTAFAVSHRVFLGGRKLLDLDVSWKLDALLGVFRSSGRLFWPALYVVMLTGLVLVLRRLAPGWKTAVVAGCCMLQLVDTEPLRAHLATLARLDVPRVLDQSEWQARMLGAAAVHIDPPFACAPRDLPVVNMELQLAAMAADRPVNSVYNPRLSLDCAAEAAGARTGPWRDDTLYVFLAGGPKGVPVGWMPAGLTCQPFKEGVWCFGLKLRPE
jgi:hypothetical protein